VDDLSGNLITTGQTLQTQITSNDGDITSLSSNLTTTGQTLQTQITSNDADIATLDSTTVKITTNQSVAGNKIFTDTVTINNLTVTGTEVIVDVENLAVRDNIIHINSGESGAGISRISGGITIDRGTETAANILYNDANDRFELNFPLATEGNVVASATNLITTGQTLTTNINTVSTNLVSTGAIVDDVSGNLITTGQTLQTQITSNDTDITNLSSNLVTTGQTLTTNTNTVATNLVTTGQTLTSEIATVSGLIPATVIDGGGTANKVPLWSDANTIGDSVISQSSSKIGIGTATPSAPLHVAVDGTAEILLERTTDLSGMPSQIRIKSAYGSEWALTNNLAGSGRFSIRDVTDSRHVMVFDGDGIVTTNKLEPINGNDSGYLGSSSKKWKQVYFGILEADTATFSGLTNLNGQQYFVTMDSSGNLYKDSRTFGTVTGTGTANYIPKWTGTSAQGNSQIRDDGTLVGIGVAGITGFKLNVAGAINSSGSMLVANTSYFGSYDTLGSYTGLLYLNSSNQAFLGGITLAYAGYPMRVLAKYITFEPAGTLGFGIETMRITNGTQSSVGSVGIGTNSPGYLLDVNGTANIGGALTGTSATFSGGIYLTAGTLKLDDVAESIDFMQSGAINFDSDNNQTGRVFTIGSGRAAGASGGTTHMTIAEATGVTTFSGALTVGGNINKTGDLTLDVSGDIILDADGTQIVLKDNGTEFAQFLTSSTPDHLYIRSMIQDKDIILSGNDNGSFISALTLDMADAGTAIFNHDIKLANNNKAIFGLDNGSSDLEIFFNGSHSYITNNGFGRLYLRGGDVRITNAAGTETMARFDDDSEVSLYYDNALKLATASTGVTVTGALKTTTILDTNNSAGTSGQILTSTGSALDWKTLGEISGVDGSGTANYLSKWTDSDTIGNSTISDNGSTVTLASDVHIYKVGSDKKLWLSEGTSGNGLTNVQLSPNGVSYLKGGSVGIGTATPVAQLNLFKTGADDGISSSLYFQRAAGHYGCAILQVGNGSAGTEKLMFTAGHNSNPVAIGNAKMTIQQDGNVGIGTTTPSADLEVSTASGGEFLVTRSGNSGVTLQQVNGGNATSGSLSIKGGTSMSLFTGGVNRLVIDATGNVSLPADGASLKLGASADLQMWHGSDGHSYISNTTGAFWIKSTVTDGDLIFAADRGDGGGTFDYFSLDGGSTTYSGGTTVAYTKWQDNSRIALGTGKDLQLYHDGNHSYIEDTGTGALKLKSDDFRVENSSGNNLFKGVGDVASMYHNGSEKLATTSTGVTITGQLTATTKSFLIDHPDPEKKKKGIKLQYGSLEGPEHSVFVRGKSSSSIIPLPDYWRHLVDEDSITVQITPIGQHQKLYVQKVTHDSVMVGSEGNSLNYFYTVFAERIDTGKLKVEI
jgi:hypothetical protein